MLARDVVVAAEAKRHEVTALTRSELDITEADAVERALAAAGPDAVINCAAWTDVDGAEEREAEATAVNGEGARVLGAAAAAIDAAVVYPSTDYVFDGSKDEPYVVDDPPGPLSAYGRSKLAGEKATAAANSRHFIVRTSWVFGPHGRNFVETMLGLGRERDEVRVVRDQVGCPTYTGHLASGVVALIDSEAYGIHHMAGQGPCSWYEFAEEIFAQAEIECDVVPVATAEFPRPAPRPPNGVLAGGLTAAPPLPPWQHGLTEYLKRDAQVRAGGVL